MHKTAFLLLILLLAIGCVQKTETSEAAADKIDTKTIQVKEEAKPAENEKVQVAGITQPQQQLGNVAKTETEEQPDNVANSSLETQLPQINQETSAPAARPRTSSQATSSSTTNSTETNPDSGDASDSDSEQPSVPEEATVVSTATSGFEVVPE